MTVHASLPPAQAQRIVPGVPSVFYLPLPSIARHLCPRQSRGLVSNFAKKTRMGPQTCGGTAVLGEATDGDGDENSSRDIGFAIGGQPADTMRKTPDELTRLAKERLY